MSRYIKKFEVRNTEFLKNKIETFLMKKSFVLCKRKNEDTWMKSGINCKHCVIIKYEDRNIILIAFIIFHKYEPNVLGNIWTESKDETESTVKGFFGGFGKWPLQKIVRQLEKLIKENTAADFVKVVFPVTFQEQFAKFLSLFGIDYEKYKNFEIENKNGEKYKFAQIDKIRIQEFNWAYELAKFNELIVFDYRENIDKLTAKFNAFQNGRIKDVCGWYKDDAERLRLAKDMGYFIRDIDNRVQLEKDQRMIYIDNNDPDIYILAVTSVGRNNGWIKPHGENAIQNFRELGLKMELNTLNAFNFPYIQVKRLTPENCNKPDTQIYGLTYQKNMVYDLRNDEEIIIASKREIEKQKAIMYKRFSDKEESVAKQLAKKAIETGDPSLCAGKPELKEKVVEAYKIVLLNKIGEVDDLRCENVEGSLWHWFNEEEANPTIQEIVFFIRDRIADYR